MGLYGVGTDKLPTFDKDRREMWYGWVPFLGRTYGENTRIVVPACGVLGGRAK